MKAFLDTSVLLATFYGDHEHHAASLDVFVRFGKRNTCCAAHSLAEVYSVLTGMPGRRGVGADAALLFIGSIRQHLTLISLEGEEYLQLVEKIAASRITSGAIYDALQARCAVKAQADTIYSWNTKDFLRLPGGLAQRAKRPDECSPDEF